MIGLVGTEPEELIAALDAETDLVRLPQVVHAASCAAFYPPIQQLCDTERCAVAHGFDAGQYADANEIVWIAAEIESKLEAGRGITEVWCDRLMQVARVCGFSRRERTAQRARRLRIQPAADGTHDGTNQCRFGGDGQTRGRA